MPLEEEMRAAAAAGVRLGRRDRGPNRQPWGDQKRSPGHPARGLAREIR